MNSFKYCPECGAKQETPNSLAPFECKNCRFTFYQNSAAAVAGVIAVKDKILFIRRANDPGKDKLGLPGGFVDHNEDLETALTREVEEEIGVTINQWHYLSTGINNYPYKNVIYQSCDAIYYCKLDTFPEIKKEDSEISAVMWIDKADVPLSEIAFESLRDAVEKFVRQHKGI